MSNIKFDKRKFYLDRIFTLVVEYEFLVGCDFEEKHPELYGMIEKAYEGNKKDPSRCGKLMDLLNTVAKLVDEANED